MISCINKASMNFHHDASNCHVPVINLLEFLVLALLIKKAKHACKSQIVSAENSLYLLMSNTWFGY